MPIKKIDLVNYVTPSDYMTFEIGDTHIAIVSNGGGMARIHGMRTTSGYKNLGMCTENASCEHCKKGYEAKLKWLFIVYWLDKKVVRLLEGGKLIGDGICKATQLARLPDFNQNEYIITATGEGLKRRYSVKLGKKLELSDEDKAIIEPAKRFLVKKYLS